MASAIFARAAEQWSHMRSDFQEYVENQYALAQRDLGPYLVRRGSPALSATLFTGSRTYAHAHASPELIEWWEQHGRMTLEEFERQWLDAHEGAGHGTA